jgi:molybdopterin converting factor small subunit
MEVRVLFFGPLSEICGCNSMQLNAEGSVQLLLAELELRFPALKDVPFKISINRKIRSGGNKLNQGDEVALLPPFAGG